MSKKRHITELLDMIAEQMGGDRPSVSAIARAMGVSPWRLFNCIHDRCAFFGSERDTLERLAYGDLKLIQNGVEYTGGRPIHKWRIADEEAPSASVDDREHKGEACSDSEEA